MRRTLTRALGARRPTTACDRQPDADRPPTRRRRAPVTRPSAGITAAATASATMNDIQNSASCTANTWPRSASSTSICMADVGAQLDHLTGRAEQEAAQHHHRQLQSGAAELDDRRQQQGPVGGAVAAPAARRRPGSAPWPGTIRRRRRRRTAPRCRSPRRSGCRCVAPSPAPAGVLMPNTIRCAASPASVPATVGHRQHRARAVQPSGGHRVDHRPVDRRAGCRAGPSTCGGNRTDSSSATATGIDDHENDRRGSRCRRRRTATGAPA